MRRIAGPALVGIGVFLLALALLLPTVVVPRVEKAPLDAYSISVATGPGSYLNPKTLQFQRNADVTITRVTRGDVKASGDEVARYDTSQTTEVSGLDEPLNVITERVNFDRNTGKGTGGVGDRPSHEDAYTVKFPFNTKKGTYLYHDATAGSAFPVKFARETTVGGLDVYEFRGTIPLQVGESLAVPGSLFGQPDRLSIFADETYENTERIVYVEPRTGSLVGGSSSPVRAFRAGDFGGQPGGTAVIFEAKVTPDPASQAELIKDAKDAKASLQLLGVTAPLVLGLLGLLALVGGILLLMRGRRDEDYYQQTSAPAHAAY